MLSLLLFSSLPKFVSPENVLTTPQLQLYLEFKPLFEILEQNYGTSLENAVLALEERGYKHLANGYLGGSLTKLIRAELVYLGTPYVAQD